MEGRGSVGRGGSRGGRGGGRGGGNMGAGSGRGGYRHNSFTAPKQLDPKQHDYHKKVKARNEKAEKNAGEYGEARGDSSFI